MSKGDSGPPQGRGASRGDASAGQRPEWSRLHLWQIQFVRDGLLVGAALLLLWLGYAMSVVTVPLLLALALAYLLEPITRRLTRLGMSRRAAAGLLIAALGLVVVVPLAFGAVLAVLQGATLLERVPKWWTSLTERAGSLEHTEFLGVQVGDFFRSTVEILDRNKEKIITGAAQGAEALAHLVGAVLKGVVAFGLLAFLVIFFFFFFCSYYQAVLDFFAKLIPDRGRERTTYLIKRMDHVVSAFVRGQFVIAGLLGLYSGIGWWLCGVPSALFMGFLAGSLSLIPYAIGLTWPLAVALLWLDQMQSQQPMAWYWVVFWPSVVWAGGQVLEGYVLQPLIHGRNTNLDAATIVVAVLGGASIAGVYGALLAIPVAACAKILVIEVLWPRFKAWTEGRASDPLPIDGGEHGGR